MDKKVFLYCIWQMKPKLLGVLKSTLIQENITDKLKKKPKASC